MIAPTIAISAANSLLNFFKESLSALVKDAKNETVQLFLGGLEDYIENYYNKYATTKTFIYRDEKVNFYDVFFPVTIRSKDEKFSSFEQMDKLFNERRFITIIGSAGSGKSMLLKHIFLATTDQRFKIPIVVELRNLNGFDGTLTDYIGKILTKSKIAASEKIMERMLKSGNFIFLFDGYDEIFSSHKEKITFDLEEFVDYYSSNIFVITSRPGSNSESLQRFDNFYVQPLKKKQIGEFINLQFKNHENKEHIGKIMTVIDKPENHDYKDYLANPLLLSMFIFAFNNYPELPKRKSKFYWNVFDTLCTKHDTFTKKGFWLHERKSKLQNDDFEKVLKWFSYISIFSGNYTFDIHFLKSTLTDICKKLNLSVVIEDLIYDLNVSICILILDGTDYTFPHKSLQEYFTACLIKDLKEEQKRKIYEEKFAQLKYYSTGGHSNLYNLCYELDKQSFLGYFILPNTKNTLDAVDSSSHEATIKSLAKVFDLSFGASRKDNILSIVSYSCALLLIDSYATFVSKEQLDLDFEVLNDSAELIKSELEKNIAINNDQSIKRQNFMIYEEWNNNVWTYVKQTGIDESFLKIYNSMKENYEVFKVEVEETEINTNDLLDI